MCVHSLAISLRQRCITPVLTTLHRAISTASRTTHPAPCSALCTASQYKWSTITDALLTLSTQRILCATTVTVMNTAIGAKTSADLSSALRVL